MPGGTGHASDSVTTGTGVTAHPHHLAPADPATLEAIAEGLAADGVYDPAQGAPRHFRIGAAPFALDAATHRLVTTLGDHLLAFYRALNSLDRRARRGTAPAFVAHWLDLGKPEDVLRLARNGRFKNHIPRVIRPDLFITNGGHAITELDSVPGGMGITDALASRYAHAGFNVLGGADGMANGFASIFRAMTDRADATIAIVVSDESDAYRDEMTYLAMRLKALGLSAHVLHPSDIAFAETGLGFSRLGEPVTIDVLYRFFELFDLPNIPKAELMLYAAKKGTVALTPPPKPALEEKLAMALFHHPALTGFWEKELGRDHHEALSGIIPHTWVLDPAPVPPHATIPGLLADGKPVQNWDQLKPLGQKARQFVVKPSGFSETAWGARGVVIGHDVSEADWALALDAALAAFPRTTHILQPFHKAKRHQVPFMGTEGGIARMSARARLCPYYFVTGNGNHMTTTLGGVLATLCPEDKKRIHGMGDAVMVPVAAEPG